MDVTDLDESTLLPEDLGADEQSEMESIESSMEALNGHIERIAEIGGISMEMAEQLVVEHAIELGRIPVKSFTKEPSTTNLKVAQEAITVGQAVLIGALVGVAAALLIKLTMWMVEYFRSNRTKEAKTSVVVNNVMALSEAMEEVEPLFQGTPLQEIRKRLGNDREMLSQMRAIHEDLLTSGPYSTFLGTCWEKLDQWEEKLSEKISNYIRLSGQVVREGDQRSNDVLVDMLDEIARPIPMFAYPNEVVSGTFVAESIHSDILPVANAIYQSVTKLDQQAIAVDDIDRLVKRVVDGAFVTRSVYGPMEGSLRGAVRLNAAAKKLKSVEKTTSSDPRVASTYSKALKNITEETRALVVMWNSVEVMASARRRLLTLSLNRMLAFFSELNKLAVASDDNELRGRVAKITAELKRRMRRF
ncbi:hypothetical protein Xoosp14_4 [Xanthomonas phage Xoo-sp14]|nr:hypothetical protein Xoosp14_4 [Xanthomonas phage Xoo-sp14]